MTLIVFTLRYPFADYAEVFLDTEMQYLADFDRVIFCHFGKERNDVRPEALARINAIVDVIGVPIIRGHTWALWMRALLVLPAAGPDLLREVMARAKHSGRRRPTLAVIGPSVLGILKLRIQAAVLKDELSPLLARSRVPVFYSYWFAGGAYLAGLLADELGGKAVARAHAFDVYDDIYGYRYFHSCSIRRLDAVFACSEHGMNRLRVELPDYSTRIHRAYLGTRSPAALPVTPSHHCEAFHVLTCANVNPGKRLERVVDALSLTTCGPIHWTHIGGPDAEMIALREYASERLRSRPEITSDFLGFLSNEEVTTYYESSHVDLFVSTSDHEGLPVTMMEAMSFGVPVVGTDVGGVAEIVRDNVNGFIVPIDDAVEDRFAQVIDRVCSADAQTISALRSNAKQTWHEHFRAESNYSRFFRYLSSLRIQA
ncbi:glycosyltransferase [Nostocoides sp. F2B08]|uniref:glycosyltransferase n=1 Tax=Nostocoides sp. F2B08 TaxID=2653936 RepID=UPI00186B0D88|nr:glycosyltransferase [Tetrasphaera sp. F2B08]